jgi:hypothetical protein
MAARRTEPLVRCRRYGMSRLPSGRAVFITHSGLVIGCRYVAPAPRHGVHAERIQALVLWGRPLALDQVLVAAMCEPGRRP